MTLEIKVMAWKRRSNVAGLSRLMGFQPSSLDNWISNGKTYIKKPDKNLHRVAATQKDHIQSQKSMTT